MQAFESHHGGIESLSSLIHTGVSYFLDGNFILFQLNGLTMNRPSCFLRMTLKCDDFSFNKKCVWMDTNKQDLCVDKQGHLDAS